MRKILSNLFLMIDILTNLRLFTKPNCKLMMTNFTKKISQLLFLSLLGLVQHSFSQCTFSLSSTQINVSCNGGNDGSINLTVNPAASYCLPTYGTYCVSGSTNDFINNFWTTGGTTNITHMNTGCNGTFPNNFTYLSGMTVSVPGAGSSFNINVQCGATYAQGFRIWIDWNQNCVYDASENVWSSGTSGFGVFTGTITVPAGTPNGLYRMRVRSNYAGPPPNGPCGNQTYGETQDYNVQVGPAGGPPGALTYNWSNGATTEDISGLTAGTYTVTVSNGQSTQTLTATITQPPVSTPPTAAGSSICSGTSITLTASNSASGIYNWYSDAAGTNLIGTGANYTTPVLTTTTTYYVQSGGPCPSTLTPVTVNVNTIPAGPALSSNSPVCINGTINLNSAAVAGAVYVWSGPNGFTSNLQNPTIPNATAVNAGTYSAYTVVAGCTSATSTVDVIVSPPPAPPVLGSNSPVCQNGVLNLTAAVPAGSTVGWTGPAGFSSTSLTPSVASVTAANAGTYTAYSIVSGCSSSASTINVVVNPTPVTPNIVSNSPVCDGSTLLLNTNAVAGATYVWSGPNGFSSNAMSPTINPVSAAAAGTYSLYTVVNGCTSATATSNVIVNPIPSSAFIATSSVCQQQNATITYTGTASAAATYNWNFGTATVVSGSGQGPYFLTWNTPGTYPVTLTVTENGCTSPVTTQNVTVFQIPTSSFTASTGICIGANSTISYNGNASAAATYTWNFAGGTVASGSGQGPYQVNWPAAGTYAVELTVSENGCISTLGTNNVLVYPTPTANFTATPAVCPGVDATITYTGTGTAAATYNWNFAGGTITSGTGQGPYAVQWANSGNPSVSLTVTENGCTSQPFNVPVLVYPIPTSTFTIGGNVCQSADATISYTGTGSAAATYAWNFGTGTVSSGSGQGPYQVQWGASGNPSVTLTVTENGCVSTQTTQNLTVYPIPTATFTMDSAVCELSNATFTYTGTASAAATYNWDFDTLFTVNSGTAQGPYQVEWSDSGSYQISLVVIENGCVSPIFTDTIVIYDIPTAAFTAPSEVCVDQDASVTYQGTATAAATYNWNFASGTITSGTGQGPYMVQWNTPGNKMVLLTVTENGCVSAQDTQIVKVNPIPTSVFTAPASVCTAQNASLTYTGTATNTASYTWTYPSGTLQSGTGQGPLTVSWNTPGTYNLSLSVVENNCASDTTNVPITVYAIPTSTFTASGPVCELANSTLTYTGTATAAATYNWNFSGGTVASGTGQGPYQVNWANDNTYTVSLTVTENGCTSTQTSVNVLVNPIPVAQFVLPASQCLTGNSFNFTAGGTYNAGSTFAWTFPSSNTPATAIQNPSSISYPAAGNYQVTLVITDQGCVSAPVTQTLTVYALPQVGFTSNSVGGCVPVTVGFVNQTQSGSNYTSVWLFGNGDQSASQSPTYTYTSSGTYDVTLNITDANGCNASLTQNAYVNVYPIPEAGFVLLPALITMANPTISVTDQSNFGDQWLYQITDGSTYSTNDFQHQFSAEGTYTITQYVTNSFGCTDTLSDIVVVNPVTNIFIPLAFTPNGDGLNDTWEISMTYFEEFRLDVFDRWGNIVYSADDIYKQWNGQMLNSGSRLKQDSYVYRITYKDAIGKDREIFGHVSIVY
jgi:gliding motility-associated-like protein